MNTIQPITSPTPIPTNIVFFALFSLPAPTFCETNDAIDCISELGMSIAKLTILHATPYPDDACNPSLLTNAHSARNETCVRNSCNASGRPTFNALLQCLLIEKSFLVILNGSFLLKSNTSANITLTACAATVAIAAPEAFMLNPATRTMSPTILITHATATNIRGDLLSPSPLNIAERRLYATIKNIPEPHIFTYTDVRPTASLGACIITAICLEKTIITMKSTTEIIVNTTIAPPIKAPICSGFFSPIYLAISTVTPIANCVITNVTKLSTWLPVDTAERPSVVPNLPTTSKSTAPYAACNINAPSIGIIKGISFPNILPCVKSDSELFNVNSPFAHHLVEFVNSLNHRISLFITNIRQMSAKTAVIIRIILLRQLFSLIRNRNISYPCIFL